MFSKGLLAVKNSKTDRSRTNHGSDKTVTTNGSGSKNTTITSKKADQFVLEAFDAMNDKSIFLKTSYSAKNNVQLKFRGLSYSPHSNTITFKEENLKLQEAVALQPLFETAANLDINVASDFTHLFQTKNKLRAMRIKGKDQNNCVMKALAYSPVLTRLILEGVPLNKSQYLPRIYLFNLLTRVIISNVRFATSGLKASFYKVLNQSQSLRTLEVKGSPTKIANKKFNISSITSNKRLREDSKNFFLVNGLVSGHRISFSKDGGTPISKRCEAIYWLNELRKADIFMSISFDLPYISFKASEDYSVDPIKALEATVRPYYLNPELWRNSTLGDKVN